MSEYAYRDKARKDIIYASSALAEDRGKIFFCPNAECGAHLYLCAVDGSTSAYFRATKQEYHHIDGCPYKSNSNNFKDELYDEEKFVFDDAIVNLFSGINEKKNSKNSGKYSTGDVEKHPPRTLSQIYWMCKSRKITDIYGDKEIGDMILEGRSLYRYPKGCFGYKIIEARTQRRFYDKEKQQIFLYSPCNERKYSFVLQFYDEKLFKAIKDELWNNKELMFAVAGCWKSSGTYNHFISDITSAKQVLVIK